MEEKINELQHVVDSLLVQLSEITIREKAIFEMVMGVYRDTLSEEQFNNVYTHWVDRFSELYEEHFRDLEDVVFDKSILIRNRFELLSNISLLKKSNHYVVL